MKKINISSIALASAMLLPFLSGCATDTPANNIVIPQMPPYQNGNNGDIVLTPQAIPGTPRDNNHQPTGGYAPSHVQTQFKIDVNDETREIKVIRDNTDPYVITKPYMLKNADPYAVRSYLEAAVGAKSINSSPAQVTAVKFADGAGAILVSAEDYRFADSELGKGIDGIVASLDREGLTFFPEADAFIYFPRISKAANLREMLIQVGSSELDPQFAIAPGTIIVDAELNALIIKASQWNKNDMLAMLKQYDKPIPELKITYRVIEIFAENDDRIGVDFQSWKNNEGVDLFSTGTIVRRNWGTFFSSAIEGNGSHRTSYWNFNPKWNTRYLDFMTSIGKAKCLAQGEMVVQNRNTSTIQVNSGFFYDRTYYTAGAKTIAEGCTEFTYTDINPDTIVRESTTKILPIEKLNELYASMGTATYMTKAGYTMRVMGTQVGTATYYDAIARQTYQQIIASNTNPLTGKTFTSQEEAHNVATIIANSKTSAISKYLSGYVDANGNRYTGNYYREDYGYVDSAPGIIHGWLQYPMVTEGFQFTFSVTPIVTGKAASMKIDLQGLSLMGWNSDGSTRRSKSETSTTLQLPYNSQEFVIGGIRKSESVRSAAGLPFLKDLPVIGRAFSTESESIKQSQLVVIARVEYSNPDSYATTEIREDLGKIVDNVNGGMTSRVGNMFFQQYGLDEDRADRAERLDEVGNFINDEYQTIK